MRTLLLTSVLIHQSAAAASSLPALFAPQTRPIFSASPLSLNTSQYQFVIDETIPLIGDFDAVSIDLSTYGIPWNSFLYEEPLPVSWAERLDAAVKGVDTYDLPVVLQFAILGSDKRSCPSSNASDYPGTTSPGVSDFAGCTRCFDYNIVTNPIASFVRQGYVNYALAVSYAFNTTGTLGIINYGVDANLYLRDGCSAQNWQDFKDFTQQVYSTLKELYPAMAIFTSNNLEQLVSLARRREAPAQTCSTQQPFLTFSVAFARP